MGAQTRLKTANEMKLNKYVIPALVMLAVLAIVATVLYERAMANHLLNLCIADTKTLNMDEKALRECSGAIELNPKLAEAYLARGEYFAARFISKPAINDFTRAIELKPEMEDAFIARGYVYYESEQYDLAIKDFTHAIELKPDDARAYDGRAVAYHGAGQYRLALMDYDREIKMIPNAAGAYYNRGLAYLDQNQYDSAIRDFDQSMKLGHGSELEISAAEAKRDALKKRDGK